MKDIEAAFSEFNWQSVSVSDSFAVFSNEYALAGVAPSPNAEHILNRWSELQANLFELKKKAEFVKRDLYLIFLLEEESPESWKQLQLVMDDTQVCRKIILPVRKRVSTEVLRDASLFQNIGASVAEQNATTPLASTLGEALVNDLTKKSAWNIFERLMNNNYE